MSKIVPKQIPCAICGTVSKQMIVYSIYYFNPPDLDGYNHNNPNYLRLQECPHCHYVSADISKPLDFDISKSTEYKKLISDFEGQERTLQL